MSERQEENIGNLKKLRAMIKKDMNTVAQVNKAQAALEGLNAAGRKELAPEIKKFRALRKNVLAREEAEPKFRDSPASRKAMAPKEGGPKTPTKLPKPKPKRPTQVAAAKKKSSGVTFDTSGTLPGQTIKRMNNGGAVMPGRGGKFKGIS
tara:strand:- start:42 stop:491 length:450 start_codon:yes stop_codon:yes gene_type:complete